MEQEHLFETDAADPVDTRLLAINGLKASIEAGYMTVQAARGIAEHYGIEVKDGELA